MVTWINPNLGFNGVQFLKEQWSTLVREHGTQYRYQDGVFVTQRNYNPAVPVTTNTIPLRPLVLLGTPLARGYKMPDPIDVERPQRFKVTPCG